MLVRVKDLTFCNSEYQVKTRHTFVFFCIRLKVLQIVIKLWEDVIEDPGKGSRIEDLGKQYNTENSNPGQSGFRLQDFECVKKADMHSVHCTQHNLKWSPKMTFRKNHSGPLLNPCSFLRQFPTVPKILFFIWTLQHKRTRANGSCNKWFFLGFLLPTIPQP